jgi:xylose isomerase
MKQGVIIGFLGKTQDRFSDYQSPATLPKNCKSLVVIEGFDGVEMVFPYENSDPETTRKWMDDVQTEFCSH